ncbi:MAG: MerR family transcriptional regulator [Nocardioides sp.]
MGLQHAQIGEVAERTGLSLRTIRYYEEVGLVTPSGRTAGGFRLYAESDVARLLLIRRMKPLGFSLDEMRDVLAVLDELDAAPDGARRDDLIARLEAHRRDADERVEQLQRRLEVAEGFAADLRREINRQKKIVKARQAQ